MPGEHEKTFTQGLLGGADEHEANLRRKLQIFLNHFRSVAEMENFLHDIDNINKDRKSLVELRDHVKKMETALDDILEAQERRTWLMGSATGFLKWAAIAGAGVAVISQFWGAIKAALGGGP